MPEAADDPGRLAARLAGGLAWHGASQAARIAVRVVSVLVVARQLGPRETGLAAMASAIVVLGAVFSDAAMGSALVQRPEVGQRERSTAFWLSLGAGVLLTLLAVACSGPVAALFGEPRVAGLFAAAAAGFTLSALATVPQALLQRRMDFRRTELAATAGVAVGAVAAVALAYTGAGAWALVAQGLAGAAVATALLWALARPRVDRGVSRASARALGAFGARVLGSRLLFALHRSADNVLVGGVLGAAPLGAYSLAYNTMMEPFGRLVDPVRAVLYPAMSRVQDDLARVRGLWLRGTRALVAVLTPLLLTIAVAAPDLVSVLLGARWADAADPMRVLAVVGAAQAVIALNSVVLTALGHTKALVRFALLTFVLSVAGFAAGLPFGITGVAAGYAVANLAILPAYVRITAGAVAAPALDLARALGGPAQAAVLTLGALVAVRAVLDAAGAGAAVRLAVVLAAAVPVAVGAARWRAPEVAADVRVLLAAAGRRGGAAPSEARSLPGESP